MKFLIDFLVGSVILILVILFYLAFAYAGITIYNQGLKDIPADILAAFLLIVGAIAIGYSVRD